MPSKTNGSSISRKWGSQYVGDMLGYARVSTGDQRLDLQLTP